MNQLFAVTTHVLNLTAVEINLAIKMNLKIQCKISAPPQKMRFMEKTCTKIVYHTLIDKKIKTVFKITQNICHSTIKRNVGV